MKDIFLIIDGNSLLHRAYHAIPLMTTRDGVYTNAIHGFMMMLLKAVREEHAAYLAVCFDEHGPTFRHEAYPEYKAGRRKTDPELRQQFDTLFSLLDDLGVKRYHLAGWEADDLLGTLSLRGTEAGVTPLLLTGDRDALQLVGHGAELLFTRKGLSETVRFTPAMVYETYGFTPEQVTDWKGLAGDSSDNIPGIPGIGDKTAVKLLQQYGSLEAVLAHAGEVKGKLGEKLRDGADQARMCKDLATIRRDAPVDWHLADCSLPDFAAGIPALQALQLNQVIRTLGGPAAPSPAPAAAAPGAAEQAEEPAPIAFGEPAEALAPADITRWLADLPADARPVALRLTDLDASLAAGNGHWLTLHLGGDLLNPGLDPAEVLSALAEDLAAHPAVVHDGKELLHKLHDRGLPLPEAFAWDTKLGAYLLNPQEKSYAFASLRGDLPDDARGLLTLARRQEIRVRSEGMEDLMRQVELPLSHVLFRMEDAGFRVDTAFLRALGDRYTAELEQLRQQIYTACGVPPFNLNSTQQLGDVLFEQLKLPHGKKTTRGYSTSAEVLEELRPIAPDVIEPLLRYRQLVKLNGTYIEGMLPLVDGEGRIHSYFDQVATATGRISSSEPNLQNIPVRTPEGREIRQAFLPRPGWVLVDADYSQIELRLMAHFSGDAAMVEAFTRGQDVHARTASEIFDVPLEAVTPELRSRAKAVNFGLIYGISGFGLARNTGVSRQEAQEFITRYFAKYPGVKRFMDEAAEEGKQRGWAVTLMGRRRYLPELQSKQAAVREFGKRAAMNTPVQGTAADIIKAAMVEVDRRLRAEGLQSRLILQVHDELILESPPEEVDRAAKLLQESMEQVIRLQVPLVAEVHTGATWAEAK
ncbi:MAG: DNA polymerase I [Clostridia bacterium]|nr:DNA polymerase I [Clostridia bacterium]